MTLTVAPTQETILTKLRALLVAIVPAGVPVVQGLDNRTPPPPASPGYIILTCVLRTRLRTNVDRYTDPVTSIGVDAAEQGTQLSVQVDCYGPTSGDWATMIQTMFRSSWACDRLAPEAAPLFVEEPKQAPLVSSEEQYEERWIVGAQLQYNPVTSTPQEFADTLAVELVNVDERYPPI